MKYYLITLQGQGDTEVKLVNEDAWNAMDDGIYTQALRIDYHTQYGSRYTPAEMDAEIDDIEANYGGSSPENDVALSLPCVTIGGQLCFWHSVGDALKWLRAHPEINIEDEYEGYIY